MSRKQLIAATVIFIILTVIATVFTGIYNINVRGTSFFDIETISILFFFPFLYAGIVWLLRKMSIKI